MHILKYSFSFFITSKSYLSMTCTFRQELNISRICLSFCKAQSEYASAYLQHERRGRILLKIICQTLYTRVTKVRQTELAVKFKVNFTTCISCCQHQTQLKGGVPLIQLYFISQCKQIPPVLSSPFLVLHNQKAKS